MNEAPSRWKRIRKLGAGGQGEVYLAADERALEVIRQTIKSGFGKSVYGPGEDPLLQMLDSLEVLRKYFDSTTSDFAALKLLYEPTEKGEEYEKAKQRMRREIKALASLDHPNVIKIVDHDPDARWYLSEYFEQGSLHEKHTCFRGNPIGAVEAFAQLVDGAALLHRSNLIHRDIKPQNILIRDDRTLVLADFGLVYFADEAHTRVSDSFEKVGTSDWMPTWAQGHFKLQDVRPSFDVFALAKILWAMISGERFLRLHYYDKPEFNLVEKFPKNRYVSLVNEHILSKCLVEDEGACLPSAAELKQATDDLLRRLRAEEARCCVMCDGGKYVGDSQAVTGQSGRLRLHCDNCGYTVAFIAYPDRKNPWWVDVLSDKHGILA